MNRQMMALFGESEKGNFQTVYYFQTLDQLVEHLGQPPPYTRGIFMAVQALLYHRDLIFIRVREGGYSFQDYYKGLRLLTQETRIQDLAAMAIPGVGDASLLEATTTVCAIHDSVLLTNEEDLYDYLTCHDRAA